MLTRVATNRDGMVLQELMAKAPQGSPDRLSVTLITAPDYFGRARMYEDATVFVSDVDGEPAGSASVTIRDVTVGDRTERVGYEFQYFTSIEHRRLGVAGRLRQRIEQHLTDCGATMTTALIMDDNPPSYRFFQRNGFERQRDAALTLVFLTQHADVWPNMGIRLATRADLPEIVQLLRETWAGHDLAVDWDVARLEAYAGRVIGPGLSGLLVREERGTLTACAGIWDWSAVQQVHVNAIAPEVQAQLPTFRVGDYPRQWGMTAIGYRDPDALAPLLRHIANHAYSRKIDQFGLMDLPGIADTGRFVGLPTARIEIGLYVKSLRSGAELSDRPAYVDIIDL